MVEESEATMNTITVDEIVEKRKELEDEIAQLIDRFQKETGTSVEKIETVNVRAKRKNREGFFMDEMAHLVDVRVYVTL